jgi:restriction system protein
MPRRKSLFDEFLDILESLSVLFILYLASLWFLNRANFWRWVIYGAIFFALLFIGVYILRRIRMGKREQWHSNRDLIYWLRGMKPTEFEEYIADLFSKLGYKTKVTGGAYDEGVDVVAEKDGIEHYIQCKKFITSEVSVGAMRDFYGAIADHLAKGKAFFVTTNKFTEEASRFAEGKPIELIDEFKLIKYIRQAGKDIDVNIPESQKCPECGSKLVEKDGRYGKFYGCSNYPKCKFTKNLV